MEHFNFGLLYSTSRCLKPLKNSQFMGGVTVLLADDMKAVRPFTVALASSKENDEKEKQECRHIL